MKSFVFAFGVVLGPMVLLGVSQLPDRDPGKQHVEEMVEAARMAYQAVKKEFEIASTRSADDVYAWSYRLMEAQRMNERDAQAAVQDHVDRMETLHKRITTRARGGIEGGEASNLHATQYYLAEARMKLANVQATPDTP